MKCVNWTLSARTCGRTGTQPPYPRGTTLGNALGALSIDSIQHAKHLFILKFFHNNPIPLFLLTLHKLLRRVHFTDVTVLLDNTKALIPRLENIENRSKKTTQLLCRSRVRFPRSLPDVEHYS